MGVGTALQRLGGFLEECSEKSAVTDVELETSIDPAVGDISADVTVSLADWSPGSGGTELCATSVNADGTVRLGLETADAVVPPADDVEVEPTDVTLDPDGSVRMCLEVSVSEAGAPEPTSGFDGTEAAETPEQDGTAEGEMSCDSSPPAATGERDLPPFKNPELLGEVYDSCDTFAEMADSLEMDVTAETVRRYMIDFGIHEPNSYDTSGEETTAEEDVTETEATPPVLSDGIGLPENVTAETLIETVDRSNTIYEVKHDLGVDRQDALEVLRECNLLDLVMCRLATEAEREITREDIIDRLREASSAQ